MMVCLAIWLAVPVYACTDCGAISFKENKGQWPAPVQFKAELHYANIYFEQGRISYELFDSNDMRRLRHDLHHQADYYDPVNTTIHGHAFRAVFIGADVHCQPQGQAHKSEYYNYYLGRHSDRWASGVHGYDELRYPNLYAGVDMRVYSVGVQVKYDWIVRASATQLSTIPIQMSYEGIERINIADGALHLRTTVGTVTEAAPVAYQLIHGERVAVPCVYTLVEGQVGFAAPLGWDHSYDLVIDPTLIFSTYSGSTADNFGYAATYDSKGYAYAAGSVFSPGQYPVTTGAFQGSWAGGVFATFVINGTTYFSTGTDVGITKYSPDGTQRIYSTYLGGEGDELPHSLIVNSNDELYVFGTTGSDSFPITRHAYDTSFNGGVDPGLFIGLGVRYLKGSDIYVTRFAADGKSLLASTYLGGTNNDGLNYPESQYLNFNYADEVRGEIDIDKNDNIYIATCTASKDYPTTLGSYQRKLRGVLDGCVTKMDASLQSVIWSTYYGAEGRDAIYSIGFDTAANPILTGGTTSDSLTTTTGVVQPKIGGGRADGFVTILDKNGQNILRATYWGSAEYDQNFFVESDHLGHIYVLGQTKDTSAYFIKNAAYKVRYSGQYITKFNSRLDSVIWSTTFGAGRREPDISPTAFLVDRCNSVYVSGWGSDFRREPVTPPYPFLSTQGLYVTPNAFQKTTDNNDFYVMVMKDDASAITYATYFGGAGIQEHVDGGTSRFDNKGIVYQSVCGGCGGSSAMPTTVGAVSQTNNSSNCNNAIFKLDLNVPVIIADFKSPPPLCLPAPDTFLNLSHIYDTPTTVVKWYFGDGTTSSVLNPIHTYPKSGVYTVKLVLTNPGSCNDADSISKTVVVLDNNKTDTLADVHICPNASPVQIGINLTLDSSYHFTWSPIQGLSNSTIANPFASPKLTTSYQLKISNGNCTKFFDQRVVVASDSIVITGGNVQCPGDPLKLQASSTRGQTLSYVWTPRLFILTGDSTASPTVRPTRDTTFYVTATSTLGCTYRDSIAVHVVSTLQQLTLTATPDTIRYADTATLHLRYIQASSITWQPDSTLYLTTLDSPIATPIATTAYYVEVADSLGCRVRDTITVYVRYSPCASSTIYIPNAFTPNADGTNDKLYLRTYRVETVYLTIYDRWGQQVFETHDLHTGWDGRFGGHELDPAVFGWYAEGTCPGGERFFKKGNVTLLR
jgi:gliding motility-associated-like protein